MNIDSIYNGIVLDHIQQGKAQVVYDSLNLKNLTCSVAMIMNVKSKKMGYKDIIKINEDFQVNLDVLGFIDPNITVCIIRDGVVAEKKKLELPKVIFNVVKCKNPRCITCDEPSLDHIFKLVDKENKRYRCIYCETKIEG